MRWILCSAAPLAIGLWAALPASAQGTASGRPRAAAPAPGRSSLPKSAQAPIDPAAARKMERLLAEWETKSAGIATLDARFVRIDTDPIWKSREDFAGRAILKAPNLAFLDLQKVDLKNPKTKPTFHERIVCTGKEVYQYVGDVKSIYVFPLPEDQQQRALEEGPLRFLFNMRADQIRQRYALDLVEELKNAYRIRVIPKEKIDRDAFSQAVIDLNKTTFLPDALLLSLPNGKGKQEFRFQKITPNAQVAPANFAFSDKGVETWKVIKNPGPDGQARRPAGLAPARAQPALRPKANSRTK